MNLYIPSCDFCDLEHLTTFKLAGLCKNYVQLHLLCNLKCEWSKSLCRFDHCEFYFSLRIPATFFFISLRGFCNFFFCLLPFSFLCHGRYAQCAHCTQHVMPVLHFLLQHSEKTSCGFIMVVKDKIIGKGEWNCCRARNIKFARIIRHTKQGFS